MQSIFDVTLCEQVRLRRTLINENQQKKAQFLKEKTALLRKLSDDCARKKEELRKLKDEVKLIHIDLIKFSVNMGRS